MTVLLAGATGYLGESVLAALPGEVTCVLRGDAGARGRRLAERAGREVEPLAGDVRAPRWGLGEPELARLRGRASVVVNLAAETAWGAATRDLEQTNAQGAVQGLAVAAALDVPLVHASTLYVGFGAGEVAEDLIPERPELSRYERSKCRGEHAIAAQAGAAGVPVTIARVGALVGDAAEPAPAAGTPASTGPGRPGARVPFLRFVERTAGRWPGTLPFVPGATLDVVPRDLTARALVELVEAAPPPPTAPQVRNLSLGRSTPHVETVLRSLRSSLLHRTGTALRLVPVPRAGLLAASATADRGLRGARAAAAIGLRYLADATCYGTSAGLAAATTLQGLHRALGMEEAGPAPGTQDHVLGSADGRTAAAGSFYRDWPA